VEAWVPVEEEEMTSREAGAKRERDEGRARPREDESMLNERSVRQQI
jgi:hypothetical protein